MLELEGAVRARCSQGPLFAIAVVAVIAVVDDSDIADSDKIFGNETGS
jgi:hypothetical protein